MYFEYSMIISSTIFDAIPPLDLLNEALICPGISIPTLYASIGSNAPISIS